MKREENEKTRSDRERARRDLKGFCEKRLSRLRTGKPKVRVGFLHSKGLYNDGVMVESRYYGCMSFIPFV